MNAAITLVGWFLIFGAYLAFAFGMAVLIGKAIRGPKPIETHNREQVGLPITDLTEHQRHRANRALLAQRERWGRSA